MENVFLALLGQDLGGLQEGCRAGQRSSAEKKTFLLEIFFTFKTFSSRGNKQNKMLTRQSK